MWLWVYDGCGFVVARGCGLRAWVVVVWCGLPACDGLLWVDCRRGVVGECGKKNKENELLNCGKQIMKN
jgi:hypothetical protein